MIQYSSNAAVQTIINAHADKGHVVDVGGVPTFYLDEGKGDPVVLLHGVPSSSFLYRKVVPVLAGAGLRGISMDFPGMGLSGKPADFDYSWTGLKNHLRSFIDGLNLKKFHLVIHDIGGPVGMMLAADLINEGNSGCIKTLTVLNTMADAATFHRPFPMFIFPIPVIGELWLAMMNHTTTNILFRLSGVKNMDKTSHQEIAAYSDLLKFNNGSQSFLKIMRGFELTDATEKDCHAALMHNGYRKQVIWGVDDPALSFDKFGRRIIELAQPETVHELPGKHFFQEESYDEIGNQIAKFAKTN